MKLSQLRLLILKDKPNWGFSEWFKANKIAIKMLKTYRKELNHK